MIGLMWYDPSPKKAQAEKIAQAAGLFQEKYGKPATICMVRIGSPEDTPAGIALRFRKYILTNHFYVGIEEDQK